MRHRRTANYAGAPAVAAGTASTTVASAALETRTAAAAETAAAPHRSVSDNTPPKSPLRLHPNPRSSAAGEATTAWVSAPSPRQPTRIKSSKRGCSSKKAKRRKGEQASRGNRRQELERRRRKRGRSRRRSLSFADARSEFKGWPFTTQLPSGE